MRSSKLIFSFLILLICNYLLAQVPSRNIYFIGDAGNLQYEQDPLKWLLSRPNVNDSNHVMVFLGDNIYFRGLPHKEDPLRADAEDKINRVLDQIQGFKGKIIFIPGNHDWDHSDKNGMVNVQLQAEFIQARLNRSDVFFPQNACPGPDLVELDDHTVLIILDTQWWLHAYEKPGINSDCKAKNEVEIINQLDDLLYQNKDKKIIVMAHHPMESNGVHSGKSNLLTHLFPLTLYQKNAYIPLPGLGSLYALYRRISGSAQDMPHPKNKRMIQKIKSILNKYPGILYVNGHDHSLQYIVKDGLHYVTCGSASYASYIDKSKKSIYQNRSIGYAELNIPTSLDSTRLSFYTSKGQDAQFTLPTLKPIYIESKVVDSVHQFEVLAKAANQELTAKTWFKRVLLGKSYRREWTTPVKAELFDIGKELGGLKYTKRGGGMQSVTLRLVDSTNREFVLRSMSKDPTPILDVVEGGLSDSKFARDFVKDGVSGSHPYSFLAVPILAEAVGVPHSNPKLVYVPDDPRFGRYRSLYANTVNLFEERNPLYEKKKKLYSTWTTLAHLMKDNLNVVKEEDVLRARVFDVLIGDWDRHRDQWQWISIEKDGLNYYSPIPRDRDQAFFYNTGLVAKLLGRDFAFPRWQGYKLKYRNINSYMEGAYDFDRQFLNGLDKSKWLEIVKDVQSKVTDDIIQMAMDQIPKEVQDFHETEIIAKLKSIRAQLPSLIMQYYHYLAQDVAIKGSNKKELFKIIRHDEKSTTIEVYALNKQDEIGSLIYKRKFVADETNSINLYAFEGEDIFELTGLSNNEIKLRILGGPDKDKINDLSNFKPGFEPTKVYDLKGGIKVPKSKGIYSNLSNDIKVYDFYPMQFNKGKYIVYPTINLNSPLDGRSIGFIYRKNQNTFQTKNGYSSSFSAKYLFDYKGLQLNYRNVRNINYDKSQIIFGLQGDLHTFANSFFGYGNESSPLINGPYNRAYFSVRNSSIQGGLEYKAKVSQHGVLHLGTKYLGVSLEAKEGTFIKNEALSKIDPSTFQFKHFANAHINFELDRRNNAFNPALGSFLVLRNVLTKDLTNSSIPVLKSNIEYSIYWSNAVPASITIAQRFGAGYTSSNFSVFQSQILGGSNNLRGFLNFRFAGDRMLFSNTEVRIPVARIKSIMIPFNVGILVFHDIGKVYYKNEISEKWHRSYGGGIYVIPLNIVSFSLTYNRTEDDPVFTNFQKIDFRLGWTF